jgi:hypothetical protein
LRQGLAPKTENCWEVTGERWLQTFRMVDGEPQAILISGVESGADSVIPP